eukprot:6022476-Pyramimonas_sp.AAC.1
MRHPRSPQEAPQRLQNCSPEAPSEKTPTSIHEDFDPQPMCVSKLCWSSLKPPWCPLGQSIGSLRQGANHISKDLLEDRPACPT